jgi:Family of unknown function (DUF5995)
MLRGKMFGVSEQPQPPPPIRTVETIEEVVDAIDSVIRWSIATSNPLGYFAAVYKRITVAVLEAVKGNKFENGERMKRFDVAFANRYFEALNGHFHPDAYERPTHAWRVTFAKAEQVEPIMLQHILGGVNAHIGLDLGIIADGVARGRRRELRTLRKDYSTINKILAGEVKGVLRPIYKLSPRLKHYFNPAKGLTIALINLSLALSRGMAWAFAVHLAWTPTRFDPAVQSLRDRLVRLQGFFTYRTFGPIAGLVRDIAAWESRDVAVNVRELDEVASRS